MNAKIITEKIFAYHMDDIQKIIKQILDPQTVFIKKNDKEIIVKNQL
jgi:hypothetical protein